MIWYGWGRNRNVFCRLSIRNNLLNMTFKVIVVSEPYCRSDCCLIVNLLIGRGEKTTNYSTKWELHKNTITMGCQYHRNFCCSCHNRCCWLTFCSPDWSIMGNPVSWKLFCDRIIYAKCHFLENIYHMEILSMMDNWNILSESVFILHFACHLHILLLV